MELDKLSKRDQHNWPQQPLNSTSIYLEMDDVKEKAERYQPAL